MAHLLAMTTTTLVTGEVTGSGIGLAILQARIIPIRAWRFRRNRPYRRPCWTAWSTAWTRRVTCSFRKMLPK